MSEEEINEDESPQKEVSGWADAMSKILGSNKPKKKKTLILSRAKKDYEVRKSELPPPGGEVEVVNSEGQKQKPDRQKKAPGKRTVKGKKRQAAEGGDDDEEVSLKKRRKIELKQKKLQREWENLNRVRPDSTKDREEERELMKIATKGVVELFNAVNLQKKSLGKKLRNAPRSEFKKDKILSETKDLFEDALETVVTTKKRR